MANIKLDLSKFKHLSSDDKSTTLKHYEGHTLTLAHNKLSKVNQEQLKAMANLSKGNAKPTDKSEAKADQQMKQPQEAPAKMAEGGGIGQWLDDTADRLSGQAKPPVERGSNQQTTIKGTPAQKRNPMHEQVSGYAEGGDVQPQEDIQDSQKLPEFANPEPPQFLKNNVASQDITNFDPNQQIQDKPPEAVYKAKFDELKKTFPSQPDEVIDRTVLKDMGEQNADMNNRSQDRQAETQNDAAKQQYEKEFQQEMKSGVDQAYDKRRMQAGLPPVSAQAPMQPQQQMQQLAQPVSQIQQPQVAQSSLDPISQGMERGYGLQELGMAGQAAALGQQGVEESAALAKQQVAQADAQKAFKAKAQELDNYYKGYEHDIQNGYIDPNKYWEGYTAANGDKVPGHSRMAAAIGMLIAGFNPSNKPNAVIDLINKQIDQSLDSQKQNLQSSHNLLRANLEHFKNVKDATEMTRAMINDAAISQIQRAAANAKTPLAAAAALQAIGPLEREKTMALQRVTMSQALMNLNNGGSSKNPSDTSAAEHLLQQMYQFAPDQAKELAPRVVPGVGVSAIAVPSDVRSKLIAHQQLEHSVKDLQQFVKTHTTLIPGTPDYNVGAQKALALQSAVREGELGTVYKEGEQPLLDKFINSNPAGMMKTLRTIPQLNELLGSNNRKFNDLKRAYGLPMQQTQSSGGNAGSHPLEGKTATNASGAKMIMRNGQWQPVK